MEGLTAQSFAVKRLTQKWPGSGGSASIAGEGAPVGSARKIRPQMPKFEHLEQ
jgi:hypothetical protein